jgi:hypothetical protein
MVRLDLTISRRFLNPVLCLFTPDEELYINALAPLLSQNNYPAHFIVDRASIHPLFYNSLTNFFNLTKNLAPVSLTSELLRVTGATSWALVLASGPRLIPEIP